MMPPATRAALDRMLEGVSRSDLADRASRMSAIYRDGGSSDTAVRDRLDALAYAVARMPATYAAIEAAARQAFAAERWPAGLRSGSVLDIGAGPGTATLALGAALGEAALDARIVSATLIEPNPELRRLGEALLAVANGAHRYIDDRVSGLSGAAHAADIVVMSYLLVELDEAAARRAVGAAMELARDAVLLVEPGTPAGFARLRAARTQVLAAGFSPLAPCPGAMACPMAGGDWCHFSVRLARSRDHKLVKGADAPFEDERFSYFAAARANGNPAGARVLAAPVRDKTAIEAKLCTPSGVRRASFARRDKARWMLGKALDWGDGIDLMQPGLE